MDAVKRQGLIDFFASLPTPTLRMAVRDTGLVTEDEFDGISKQEAFTAEKKQLPAEIVDRHYDRHRLPDLLHAVGRLIYSDDIYRNALAPLIAQLCPADDNHQAALAKRAHTLPLKDIGPFCHRIQGNICVVTANWPGQPVKFGTGILVGENLVLTAFHTLDSHITKLDRQPIPGGRLFAFFEHIGLGAALDPDEEPPKEVLKVAFAEDWLVACCAHMPDDGAFLKPSEAQKAQLHEHLDFALVRLAEPVGRYTRQFSGGERRLWWDINKHCGTYLDDERIIIPQHTNGLPQRIDFGRYCELESSYDTSATRIRYNTETDRGASGAPCFNQRFEFVGLHNATFRPDGIMLKRNQGIRADRILAKLKSVASLLAPASLKADVPLWSVSNDPARPRPILGRSQLLGWIDSAADDRKSATEYRCYIADADGERVGRSFSREILEAARRGKGGEEPVIVLGNGEQIPESAEDFVKSLAHQLRVPKEEFDRFPQRPSARSSLAPDLLAPSAPGGGGLYETGDLDKLEKWKSEDLPNWLGVAMHRHPAAAMAAVAAPAAGVAAQEAVRPRHHRVWIVLDNLHRVPLSSEVEDVLAGLMGLNRPEALPVNLHAMRWLCLGATPRVLLPHRPTVEKLRPDAIGAAETRAVLDCMIASNNLPAHIAEFLHGMVESWLMGDDPRLKQTHLRLQAIQSHMGNAAAHFHENFRSGARG